MSVYIYNIERERGILNPGVDRNDQNMENVMEI